MSRVFEIKIVQPNFNDLYKKYEKFFGSNELIDLINSNNSVQDFIILLNLTEKIPNDIQELYKELDKCFQGNLKYACMHLIRRIIALSIIKKFQQANIESELRDSSNNEYYNLAILLNKSQKFIESNLYNELLGIKFINNSVQNNFTITISSGEIDYAIPRLRSFIINLFK